MGIEALDAEDMASNAQRFGGDPSDYARMIVGGDYREALDLCQWVSGGEDECAAYLGWLDQRTRNMIEREDFWPAVEAVAAALDVKKTLSGSAAREVISQARNDVMAPRLEQLRTRTAR